MRKRNRRISRIIEKPKPCPKNVRITERKNGAVDRAFIWLLAALATLSSGSATLYLALFGAEYIRSLLPIELFALYTAAAYCTGLFSTLKTYSAWNEVSACDDALRRRTELLRLIKRQERY